MSKAADMSLTGAVCQECGEFIGSPVGYPRSCEECISSNTEAMPTAAELLLFLEGDDEDEV